MPPTTPTKLQRWLDLIAFLAVRRFPVTVDELMEGVVGYARQWVDADETTRESTRRKFERDKDELREAGIPIATVECRRDGEAQLGYSLRESDFHLPYLRLVREAGELDTRSPSHAVYADPRSSAASGFELTPAEARIALEGLRRVAALPDFPYRHEARSALRKLSLDLGPNAPESDPVVWLGASDDEDPERLPLLADALLRRRTVRFRYHTIHRDSVEERVVQPWGLLFQHGRWYLVGHDEGRGALRVFRVSRVGGPELASPRGKGGEFEVPAEFDLADYTDRDAWELGSGDDADPVRAVVRFAFPRSVWAERNGHGTWMETLDDGSHLRAFDVHEEDPFLRWMLTLSGEAEIVEPAPLADALRELAQSVVRLYEGDGEVHS